MPGPGQGSKCCISTTEDLETLYSTHIEPSSAAVLGLEFPEADRQQTMLLPVTGWTGIGGPQAYTITDVSKYPIHTASWSVADGNADASHQGNKQNTCPRLQKKPSPCQSHPSLPPPHPLPSHPSLPPSLPPSPPPSPARSGSAPGRSALNPNRTSADGWPGISALSGTFVFRESRSRYGRIKMAICIGNSAPSTAAAKLQESCRKAMGGLQESFRAARNARACRKEIRTSKCMHGMNQTEAEYSRHGKRSQRASLSQIGPVVLEV